MIPIIPDINIPDDRIYMMPKDLKEKIDALIVRMPFLPQLVLDAEIADLQQEIKSRAKECGVIILGENK